MCLKLQFVKDQVLLGPHQRSTKQNSFNVQSKLPFSNNSVDSKELGLIHCGQLCALQFLSFSNGNPLEPKI